MKKYLALVGAMTVVGCASMGPDPNGSITIKGAPYETVGRRVQIGQSAPDFTALDADFKPVALARFRGRPLLISAVPSLDTQVCSLQTKRFNDALRSFPEEVAMVTISMDLPTAQKNFCSLAGIERMQVLSDSARREFGVRYGVLIAKRGLLARSVFVVGADGRLRYCEIVPELSTQPDYDAALAALRKACGPGRPGDGPTRAR